MINDDMIADMISLASTSLISDTVRNGLHVVKVHLMFTCFFSSKDISHRQLLWT